MLPFLFDTDHLTLFAHITPAPKKVTQAPSASAGCSHPALALGESLLI
jgi:hypothetical protein